MRRIQRPTHLEKEQKKPPQKRSGKRVRGVGGFLFGQYYCPREHRGCRSGNGDLTRRRIKSNGV